MRRRNHLKDNLSDIQGNILRGYRSDFGTYRFYHIRSSHQGRSWLAEILKKKTGAATDFRITTAESWVDPDGNMHRPPYTVNVAFSARGLEKLGLPDSVVKTFPQEFQDGMLQRAVSELGDDPGLPHTRSPKRTKGEEIVDPAHWEVPFLTHQIHVLIMITAKTAQQREEGVSVLTTLEQQFPGVELLKIKLDGEALTGPYKGKEHFGYADGISQPFLEGAEVLYPKGTQSPPYPGQGNPTEINDKQKATWLPIKPGEFLLGYEDELGEVVRSPIHEDLRKNGTYLVLRKLEQDVPAFHAFLKEASAGIWDQATAKQDGNVEELLAAKLMGRWRSGCPLELSPQIDDTELNHMHPDRNNDFRYLEDPDGEKCPLGAHIRRTNPRDQLQAVPRDFKKPKENRYHVNRHRMIRRGMPYGPAVSKPGERGLIFLAMMSSISRQFEFLQQQWIHDGDFLGLDSTDRDPLLGRKSDGKAKVTVPGTKSTFIPGLKQFVTERGGEYFFYPSLTAIRMLAEGKFNPRANFVSEYDSLASISDEEKRAIAQQRLVVQWIQRRPKEMFEDLLNERPILEVPKITSPVEKPSMIIVTKYHHVMEILQNKSQAFSVHLYKKKMEVPRGPFILGMEAHTAQYQRERDILKEAVPQYDIAKRIRPLIEGLVRKAMKPLKNQGRMDVIGDLAWVIPIRFNRDYFGLSHADEEVLKHWYRNLFKDIFLNLNNDEDVQRQGDKAALELNLHLDELIREQYDAIRKKQAGPKAEETVLTRLIRFQESPKTRFEDGLLGVRRNMVGMVVGVVETTLKAVARTVDQLLLPELELVLAAARAAAVKRDEKTLEAIIFEAMRFNPQNPMLVRLTMKKAVLRTGSKQKIDINPGTLVFAATLGAMFDPDKIVEAT